MQYRAEWLGLRHSFSVVRDTDTSTGTSTSSSSSPEEGLELEGKRELMRRTNEWLFGVEA